jgi:hypothetical protein
MSKTGYCVLNSHSKMREPRLSIRKLHKPSLATVGLANSSYLRAYKDTQEDFMHRFLTLAAVCLISGAMAFAQGTVSSQQPTTATQPSSNTLQSNPNSNGTSPSNGSQASRTTSAPNQALPGNSNPANAGTSDASTNGQAVRPNQSNGSAAAAGNTPTTGNPGDNSDNNGMAKDATGHNPASGRGSNTITNPGTGGTAQWFWIALLAIMVILFACAVLFARNRGRGNIDQNDPALRATSNRDDQMRRDEEKYRKVG